MKTMTEYRTLFYEKLGKTDNMDEAFTKAVWVAYLDGVAAGRADNQNSKELEWPNTPLNTSCAIKKHLPSV